MDKKSIRRILRLDKKITGIFELVDKSTCLNNSISNPFVIKYKFGIEYESGFIEYKRTLSSYSTKKDKLLRQILWRISESVVFSQIKKPTCYYIIGLEDNGDTSNQNTEEFEKSLKIILDSIIDTNIKYKFIYLYNELNKSILLVIKFWSDEELNNFNYFE